MNIFIKKYIHNTEIRLMSGDNYVIATLKGIVEDTDFIDESPKVFFESVDRLAITLRYDSSVIPDLDILLNSNINSWEDNIIDQVSDIIGHYKILDKNFIQYENINFDNGESEQQITLILSKDNDIEDLP